MCFFNPRGRHSSSSTRISGYGFARDIKHRRDLFPTDGREIIEEIVHAIPDLQVIQESLDGNAGSVKDRRAREDLGVEEDWTDLMK
jgi:hypothetical protein